MADGLEIAVAEGGVVVHVQRGALPFVQRRRQQPLSSSCPRAIPGNLTVMRLRLGARLRLAVRLPVPEDGELLRAGVVGVLQELLEDPDAGGVLLEDVVEAGGEVLLLVEALPLAAAAGAAAGHAQPAVLGTRVL